MSKLFTILSPSAIGDKRITASVGFVSPLERIDTYLVVRNKRGWDIPGGHVEKGETALEALAREIQEETASELVYGARLIAVLESTKNPTTGIAVYKATCRTNLFKPHDEIREIDLVTKDELCARYFGDKELLQELLALL